MKISNKISLSFLIAGAIISILASSILYRTVRNDLQKTIFEHLRTTARSRANHIEGFLEDHKEVIELLGTGVVFKELLSTRKDNPKYNRTLASVNSRIRNVIKISKEIFEVNLLDENGIVVASTDGTSVGSDKSADEAYLKAKESTHITDVHIHRSPRIFALDIGTPVFLNGEFLGVIMAHLNTEALFKITSDKTGLGETGETYLINKNAYMISPSRLKEDVVLKLKVDTVNARNSLEHKNKEHVNGSERIAVFPDYRGIKVLGTHEYIPEMRWGLLAEIDQEEALAPLNKLKLIFVCILIFVPLAAWLIGALISRMISGPIHRLHKGIEIIGQGNLDHKVGTDSKDEIGQLSRAFDKMTDDLKESTVSKDNLKKEIIVRQQIEEKMRTLNANLEQRVIERTAELAIINEKLREENKERKLAQATRRESEERYRSLVDNLEIGIALISPQLEILALNPKMKAWFPSVDETKQPRCGALNDPPRDGICYNCPAHKTLLDGQLHEALTKKTLVGGDIRHFRTVSTPIKDSHGHISGVIEMVEDYTDRKRAEDALRQSKELLEKTFESQADALFILDAGNPATIIECNPAALDMFGYTREEVIGQTTEFLHVDETAFSEFKKVISQAIKKDGFLHVFEFQRKRKDGAVFAVENSAALLKNEQGQHTGWISVVRDISVRKQAEQDLKASEKQNQILMEAASRSGQAIVLVQDRDGVPATFSFANKAAQQIIGYNKEELAQLSWLDIVQPSCRDSMEDRYKRRMAGEDISGLSEIAILRKDGTAMPIALGAIRTKYHGKRAMAIFFRDITEIKQLQAQLQQAQKMEAIGTLAGGIAHDFNNILAVVIGQAELLEIFDIPSHSPMRPRLSAILKAAGRAKELVQQILTFSRQMENGREPVILRDIITEALDFLRSSLPSTIEIRQRLEAKGIGVLADPTQMHQILMNLGTNAGQAMEPKGGVLEISLKEVNPNAQSLKPFADLKPGSYLELTVGDTGCGMDEALVDKIFDPYFTTKDQGKGTGLGLSVVHGIVKNHGGGITVSSTPGQGTIFRTLIPCNNNKAVEIKDQKVRQVSTGSERILIVDDEKALVKTTQDTLENLGYAVVAQTDSAEALKCFRSRPDQFDLVITDLTMPKMTGIDLSRQILSIRPDMAVILCTGYNDKITREEIRSLNICELMKKPLGVRNLAQTVRRVLDDKARNSQEPN